MHEVIDGLTPNRISHLILHERYAQLKDYVFIILGKPGLTGGTWLNAELASSGLTSIELTEYMVNAIEYTEANPTNRIIVDDDHRQVVVILNKSIK